MLATAEAGRVRIAGFTLDRARGLLLDAEGAAVALRPKAWAMLLYLADHAGQVVEREALLDAVWPDVTVTDDSVTQCVAELRRALGEAGPRLLRTVPRRGYVLDAEVRPDAPAVPSPADLPVVLLPAPVARAAGVGTWRLVVIIGAVLVLAVGAGVALWPRPVPPVVVSEPAPPAPPRTPRETATRMYREGLAAMEQVRERGGHWLAARALFERAIAADPDWAPPYSVTIYTYANMVNGGHSANPEADMRVSELLLERLASLQPEAWQTWNARAAVLRMQRRHAEALAAYQRVVTLSPGALPPRGNVALMLILLGRAEEAVEPIRATIALANPDHPFMAYWQACLGIALLHARMDDFGADAFRAASVDTALLPGVLRELHLVAALALSGETEDAEAILAELLRRESGISQATMRAAAASNEPAYLRQREALFDGLTRAGLH